jgi:flagellar assembly protein FliH
MAKNIFQAVEVNTLTNPAIIEAPTFSPAVSSANIVEEVVYVGPTAEEVREAADIEREKWEAEREAMLKEAQQKADNILHNAQTKLAESTQKVELEIANQRETSEAQAQAMIAQAQNQLESARLESEKFYITEMERAKQEGLTAGQTEGFAKGYDEAMRLVGRLHSIIDHTLDKRSAIINDVESQVVELTLLMVRKVVKVIADNQKNIVINNVIQALRKIRSRGDVVIRVNLADLEIATEHLDSFVKAIEHGGKVLLAEDSNVEQGGCVIETDFGEIDARISSQLNEIENCIRDLLPMSVKPKMLADDAF